MGHLRALMLTALLLLVASSAPTAAAQGPPTLEAKVVVTPDHATLGPGDHRAIDVSVTMTFRNFTTCRSGAMAGLDLLISDGNVAWAGANPSPVAYQFKYPQETKKGSLVIDADPDARDGNTTTYVLQPVVHDPSSDDCPGASGIQARTPSTPFTLRVQGATSTTSATTGTASGGGGSPGIGLPALLAVLGAWVLLRRRRG